MKLPTGLALLNPPLPLVTFGGECEKDGASADRLARGSEKARFEFERCEERVSSGEVESETGPRQVVDADSGWLWSWTSALERREERRLSIGC